MRKFVGCDVLGTGTLILQLTNGSLSAKGSDQHNTIYMLEYVSADLTKSSPRSRTIAWKKVIQEEASALQTLNMKLWYVGQCSK